LLLAGALLISYLIIDITLRVTDGRLSGNLAHIGEIPHIVSELGAEAGSSTLLLGNSLTNNGVDAAVLAQPVGKVTPDGSSFWDWKCIVTNQLLAHPERKVSRVVLGTAWHLASDETRADPSRLGALFCSLPQIAHPAQLGISEPGDIGEFITARGSHLYALRDTLRNRALATFIPHYKRFASEQNAAGRTDDKQPAAKHEVPYSQLEGVAKSLKARGTQLVLVLMPVKAPYEIDPALVEMAARGDLKLIDYRHLPGIESRHFVDEMHLGPDGRAVLSAQLARDLAADTSRFEDAR